MSAPQPRLRHDVAPEHAETFKAANGSRWRTLWPTRCGTEAEGPWIFANPGPYVSCPACLSARPDKETDR